MVVDNLVNNYRWLESRSTQARTPLRCIGDVHRRLRSLGFRDVHFVSMRCVSYLVDDYWSTDRYLGRA